MVPLHPSGGTSYTGTFTLTAVGGTVSYTVTELQSEVYDEQFTIENGSGTLQAGQEATVIVVVPNMVSFVPYVVVDPGGTMVGFTFTPGL